MPHNSLHSFSENVVNVVHEPTYLNFEDGCRPLVLNIVLFVVPSACVCSCCGLLSCSAHGTNIMCADVLLRHGASLDHQVSLPLVTIIVMAVELCQASVKSRATVRPDPNEVSTNSKYSVLTSMCITD